MITLKKSPFFSFLIILLLVSSLALIYVPNNTKAQSTYNVYFKVNGTGSIAWSWHDVNNPITLQHNSTTTEKLQVFNSGESFTCTASITSYDYIFTNFTFTYSGGTGTITDNPFTSTQIQSNFNITANFIQVQVFKTINVNVGDVGALIGWEQGETSGGIGNQRFAVGSSVTFTGNAIEGYQFSYFSIEELPFSSDTVITGVTTNNPLTLEITSDFMIVAHSVPLPADTYTLTIEDYALHTVGGHLEVYFGSDNTKHLNGVYNDIPANTIIEVRAFPNPNYAYLGLQTNLNFGYGSENPVRFQLTQNLTIYGVFETDRFVLTPEYNGNDEYTLLQNQTYHFYVDVFTNRTTQSSGNYLVFLSDSANSKSGANSDSIFYNCVVNSTRYQDGHFDFYIVSNTALNRDLYYSLKIVVLFDGVTYNNTVWSDTSTIQGIGYAWFTGIVQLFMGGTGTELNQLLFNGITISQGYNLHLLPISYTSVPTPTPTTTQSTPLDVLFNISPTTIAIIIYIACIVGFIIAFFFLHNNNVPVAIALGLAVATILCNVINVLGVFTYPIDAIVIIVIVAIIIFLRR